MSESTSREDVTEHLPFTLLSAATREALRQSARKNGRSVSEEAEHIIKKHLATEEEAC